MSKLGYWLTDSCGLPTFEYTGKIPYEEYLSNGQKVKLPDDPWFLLGNYRFTMFAHVSGEYELISGQRSWARINQGKKRNSGTNSSVISVDGNEFPLTGMDSLAAYPEKCKKIFGCGFANYFYNADGIEINRNLSVKPSDTPYNGASAFLLTVRVKNLLNKASECLYTEFVGANFAPIQYQTAPKESLPIKYINTYSENNSEKLASIKLRQNVTTLCLFPTEKQCRNMTVFRLCFS